MISSYNAISLDCGSSQQWYYGTVAHTVWGNYQYSTIVFFSNYLYSVGAITSTVLMSPSPTKRTILTKILTDIQGTGVKYIKKIRKN